MKNMSVILKNFILFPRRFQLKVPCLSLRSRLISNQYSINKNEQIDFLKSITGNEQFDWTEIKNNVLGMRGSLNQKNIDAVILKFTVANKKFDIALSFAKHLKSSNETLSLGAINGLLNLYYEYSKENDLSADDKQFILNTYKSLYEKYKVLDFTTCEKLLHALCSINEYKKCMKVLEDINVTGVPTHSAYSILIATLFRNNKRADALKMIERSIQNQRPLQDIAYNEWMKYIFRKYTDKDKRLKYLDEICNHISKNGTVVNMSIVKRLKESFEILDWKGKLTGIIKSSGKCKSCNVNLDCLKLSEDEFRILQSNVKDKLLVGSDLFLKTSPIELKRFLDFVEQTTPYDIVLDALNIAFTVGKGDINERMRVLTMVVNYFAQQKKKILFLGRKHMLKWRRLEYVLSKTEYFLTEDISQDDPFFITAAILSGSHTDIVSRDLLRGHRFLMKKSQLRELFQRWQWQHQWMVFVPEHRPVIQAPLKFTPIAQKNRNGWHLPYVANKALTSGLVNDGIPDCDTWLCLQKS